jgi:hypothetical protein
VTFKRKSLIKDANEPYQSTFHCSSLCSSFVPRNLLNLHQDASKPASRFQQNTFQKKTVQTATSNSRSTPTITSLLQPFKVTLYHHPQIHYNNHYPLSTQKATHTPKATPITNNVQSPLSRVPRLRLHFRQRPSPTLHSLCRRCQPWRNSGRLHGSWSPSRREL